MSQISQSEEELWPFCSSAQLSTIGCTKMEQGQCRAKLQHNTEL